MACDENTESDTAKTANDKVVGSPMSGYVHVSEDQANISRIQKQGHSYHCACRQVWGDGECECDMYSKGYDPYAWIKKGT